MPRSIVLLLALSSWMTAQTPAPPQPPPPVHSPEVRQDGTVTFRFRDPNANTVSLAREGAKAVPMQKDDQGVWTVTTDPLPPDFYGYSFVADGVGLVDPSNHLMKPNLLFQSSMVHVPGLAAIPWEISDVPRGEIHHHFYKSAVVGDSRDFYVYTPPGYNSDSKTAYPVLYLLHEFSDDASGWTAVGFANVILDNLIAQGKTKPMLVVMPLGYGAPEIVSGAAGGFRDAGLRKRNYDRFRDALFTEVMPAVEADYWVMKDRNARAIAGLSMGGAESLLVGLNALDRFAWVGSFSAGGASSDYSVDFPALNADSANSKLHLLWIACGTEDGLLESNRKFREWLKGKGIHEIEIETPGAHTWMVWRRNLASFTPLLFR